TAQDSESSIRPVSAVPFCKVLCDAAGMCRPVLSCIAYFEVTVHPSTQPVPDNAFDEDVESCVSIGIARPLFRLTELMPGWDYHSYGLHGDDGLIFHGRSTH